MRQAKNFISSITSFNSDIITQIAQNLDPNTHDHNMINICILRMGGKSNYKAFQLIFRSCIEKGKFLFELKKLTLCIIVNLCICSQFAARLLNY